MPCRSDPRRAAAGRSISSGAGMFRPSRPPKTQLLTYTRPSSRWLRRIVAGALRAGFLFCIGLHAGFDPLESVFPV
jgi:hypothetical protein